MRFYGSFPNILGFKIGPVEFQAVNFPERWYHLRLDLSFELFGSDWLYVMFGLRLLSRNIKIRLWVHE